MKNVLVIMATYNGEKYIDEQIQSLLCQKDVNVSILVRDDGSKDSTRDKLNEYQQKGILEWYTGEHLNVQKGFFDLMKKAVERDCDFVAFCDQDDVWDEDKLSVAVDRLSQFDSEIPALYYCGQRLVDKDCNFLADHTLNKDRTLKTRFVLSDFAGCTGVFNKALLKEALSYEPEYMLMHDTWILKICLCLGGNVVVDPNAHMSYRQHGKNTVGLGRGIRDYYKQVKQYINEYKVREQMQELLLGFGDRMVPQYKAIAEACCDYKTNSKSRKMLLDKKNVDFCSFGLNLTYKIKVLINKL